MNGRKPRGQDFFTLTTSFALPSMRAFKNHPVNKQTRWYRLGSLIGLFAFHFITTCNAGNIAIAVEDKSGASVKDAVVYAMPVSGKAPTLKMEGVVEQRNKQFLPYVSVI